MDRQIVCFAIPAAEIALAQLNDPRLRTRPVAIAPLNKARALIREVSSVAIQAGLAAGMSVDHARRLCPSLQVLSPNPLRVRTADESLLKVIARYAPVWELSQPGFFLMDVTGTGRLFGPAYDIAAKVQQEVLEQYQLDGVAGVGSNKLIAQTAAMLIQPSELYDVRPGSEAVFMSPLPVSTLPGLQRPCMRKVVHLLDDLNLCTLGDVAASPLDALEVAFHDYAGSLSRWAQGIDSLPVLPPTVQSTMVRGRQSGEPGSPPDRLSRHAIGSRRASGPKKPCARRFRNHIWAKDLNCTLRSGRTWRRFPSRS